MLASLSAGIDLAVAWSRARVLEIGPDESRVALGAEPPVAARHAELDGHVITLPQRAADSRWGA